MNGKMIGKGAEAELFLTRLQGKKAVCKKRVKKEYRVPELDSRLRVERTKRESRILVRVKEASVPCPTVFHVNLESKQIFMSFVKGDLLRKKIDSIEWGKLKRILKEIGEGLGRMHSAGIAHGDCTTSNIMVSRAGEVTWIDFGLSSFTQSVEEHATDLLLLKKSLSLPQFNIVLRAYAKSNRNSPAVFARLAEIEKRGRYVVRAMVK